MVHDKNARTCCTGIFLVAKQSFLAAGSYGGSSDGYPAKVGGRCCGPCFFYLFFIFFAQLTQLLRGGRAGIAGSVDGSSALVALFARGGSQCNGGDKE